MDKGRRERLWDREEAVILVTEYFKTRNLSKDDIQLSHMKISELLRKRERILTGRDIDETFRNYAGICLQSSRIRCLDETTKYCGMKPTEIQKQIFDEYLKDPAGVNKEAEDIWKKYS